MYRSTRALAALEDDLISPHPLDSSSSPASSLDQTLDDSRGHARVTSPRQPRAPSKFLQLSQAVIRNILWTVDVNTFASLCLINRQWYQEAQNVDLYAHHLSRCPSFALSNGVITGPFRKFDLFRLKTKFAAEVRRNLFDAYTRPRKTVINLISMNANSAAAFPGGEAFRFESSPNGRTVLALSSSRIYVLDATSDSIVVKRELKTTRRALSASITDDGTLLAVLSSKFQANIYGIPPTGPVQHLQCIALEHSPRTIAIAHEGTVLAAAYETGVEVFSLAANALTTDRRAVRSEAVDTLTFSGDGSMLVGSALSLDEPNAVVISAPFYTENDPDLSPREMHSRMWTTQILFPQISSVCSHVALLPGHSEGDATWLFAYDHSLLSYRAVRTDDTRSGVAYFHGPPGANRFSMPSPTIAPTTTACGTLAIAGFGGVGLCLYGVPEKLDVGPDMAAVVERHERKLQSRGIMTSATGNLEPLMAYSPSVSGTSEMIEDDALASKVDWRQSLFVKCKRLYSIHGHTSAKWVEQAEHGASGFHGKRLLVVAPGGVGSLALDLGEETMPVDGSRICLLDFDYAPSAGEDREITIEVGEMQADLLMEPTGSIATEVALERRRTIRATPGSDNSRMHLARSITAISPPTPPFANDWKPRSNSQPSSPMEETPQRRLSTSPLQRSATAAGFRHALYPPRPPLGSQQYNDQHNMVPGMGRAASVDSWESPPPPYTDGGAGHGQPPVPMMNGVPPQGRNGVLPPHHNNSNNINNNMNSNNSPLAGNAVFQNSTSAQQMQNYMPYRYMHPRASTGLDGMPTSEAAPTRRSMSQHGAFTRPARFRDPNMSNLDTVAEAFHRQNVRSMDLSSSSSDVGNSAIDSHLSRPRPLTHHGASQVVSPHSNSPLGSPNMNPISPMSSQDREYSPTSAEKARLSLTGANLQNRLNHPVPPVPEEIPEVPPVPSNLRQQPASLQTLQPQLSAVMPPITTPTMTPNTSYPSAPLATQPSHMHGAPNQPQHYSPVGQTQAPLNTTVTRRPVAGSPSSPPQHQSSWGSSGPPPNSFPVHHQFNEGISHNLTQSNMEARNALTSASTPNLVRPMYGRNDVVQSSPQERYPAASTGVGRRLSRAHSLIQQRPRVHPREQSAYHETTRTIPGLSFGRRAKADKRTTKNDNDSAKKMLRGKCTVM